MAIGEYMANIGSALATASLPFSAHCRRASDLTQAHKQKRFPALEIPGISFWKSGLERGAIAEIVGQRSSGRTSCLCHVLAQATQKGEICALVDTHNQFDPISAEKNGLELSRLLWIRCGGQVDHAIRAADLLLHAGGFGIVALDLCETSRKQLNKIPLSYWFRFRRAIESTPTILLITAELKQVNSSLVSRLELRLKASHWKGAKQCRLLRGISLSAAPQTSSLSRPESIQLAG